MKLEVPRFGKTWIRRRIVALMTVIPAMAVNYLVVIVLQAYFNFHNWWILSAVLIGDIVAFGMNSYLVDFNIKIINRFGGEYRK